MTIDSEEDIQGLRAIGRIVARCIAHMSQQLQAGMTTEELDAFGAQFLEKHGAQSAPQSCYNFPGATCISVNEEVAHGIPGGRVLQKGDMVNIDVSAERDGYFADAGATFVVGEATDAQQHLLHTGKQALQKALRHARANRPIRQVGRTMERVAQQAGFQVVRNLCSHGVGRSLHEYPELIPGYDDIHEQRNFHDGLVITLEPFVTTGDTWVKQASDGWTLYNTPGSLTAQFEHTLVIRHRAQPLIMTLP